MPRGNKEKKRFAMADQADGLLSPWLRKQRINMVSPYLRDKVLDYGCGVGVLADKCHPDFYLGVDIDDESLEIAFKKYPAFRFVNKNPKDEQFDVIVLLAVIEHIKEPVDLLKQLKLMLKSDGQIVLTTPHPFIAKIHSIGSIIGLFSASANEDHEYFFDFNRMYKLTAKAGLDILEYKRFLVGMNQLFILRSRNRAETLY